MIIIGSNEKVISDLKKHLSTCFWIKDLRPLKYFHGVEVACSKAGIFICQRKYTLYILEKVGLLGVRPTKFPMEENLKLTPTDSDLLKDLTHYRKIVGKLIYLTIIRP